MDDEEEHQKDINNDLGHYMHERKKPAPFWNKMFRERPKREVEEEIKEDLMEKEETENITPKDKKELENMEEKIEEVNKVEGDVEEKIEEEHEGLLKKFFKKLNFPEKESEEYSEDEEEHADNEHNTAEYTEEELKEFLRNMHKWLTELPSEKQQEFKHSEDFKLYTKILKAHNLIR